MENEDLVETMAIMYAIIFICFIICSCCYIFTTNNVDLRIHSNQVDHELYMENPPPYDELPPEYTRL